MTRIDRLTPEQQAMLPAHVERWTKVAMSTEPAVRPAAEAAIHEMYSCGGLEPPKRIVWCASPVAMARAAADTDSLGCVVREVRHRPRIAVAKSIAQSVSLDARTDVFQMLVRGIRPDVRPYIQTAVNEHLGRRYRVAIHGQQDAAWLSFYAYFAEQCGLVDEIELLRSQWALAEASGWAMPFRDVCFVSERQSAVHFDAQRRLHRSNGPALTYPDGRSIYAWHARTVAPELIEARRGVTPDDILSEDNAEVRRLRMEIYEDLHGAGALIRDLDAELVAEDMADSRPRRLYDVLGLEDARLLVVENGTVEPDGRTRVFTLFVPHTIETPHEAVAWSYGWPADSYREAVRS